MTAELRQVLSLERSMARDHWERPPMTPELERSLAYLSSWISQGGEAVGWDCRKGFPTHLLKFPISLGLL